VVVLKDRRIQRNTTGRQLLGLDDTSTKRQAATVEENVLVQLENLWTLPAVASRLVRGDLHLHGWVYKIDTGEVFAYDVGDGQFVKLSEYPHPQIETSIRRQTTHKIWAAWLEEKALLLRRSASPRE